MTILLPLPGIKRVTVRPTITELRFGHVELVRLDESILQ